MSTSAPPPNEPLVDPYGVDLAIGPDGDLVVSSSGSMAAVAGPYNCAQAVFVHAKTVPGEVPLHPYQGSHIPELVGSKLHVTGIVAQANADLQVLLANDPRFQSAQIAAAGSPASPNYPGSVALEAQLVLVGGEQVTLSDVSDPAVVDVSTPQPVDPTIDPTVSFDPATEQEFFADEPELDTLNDLSQVAQIVSDTPGSSITS